MQVRRPAAALVIKPGIGVRLLGLSEVIRALNSTKDPQGVSLRVDLSSKEKLGEVFTREVKRGGLFVPTTQKLAVNLNVPIELVLPGEHGVVEVRGIVVHISASPPGVGVQLLEADQVRALLINALDA